uniref:Uncharacterized protein n=1 Tax=Tanacetum cinerariifolium TaxID=118510 RepID=A0A699IA04_TANCI|nr:hypothetical protein [Tanacetum cinerariifolium]
MMSDDKLKVPVLDSHYEHWSEMMENLLRAKQVWNLIDPGIRKPVVGIAQSDAEKKKLEELRLKDMQVKHYLYQTIDQVTFEQILDRKTSKAVWDSMKQRFAGNEWVKRSMLEKLRRDFEVLEMKTSETILEYFGRVLAISNQMRSNGESMLDVKIIEKILRTLTDKYMYVVVSIEESKNVQEMSIEKLQSTLVVHEQKFKKVEREDDQAFKAEASDSPSGCGQGKRTRSRKIEANYADFDENEKIMLMAEINMEESESVFMANTSGESKGLMWFLDSGCSNHMCGDKDRFIDLDSRFSNSVKLGNNTRMMVSGKGSVKLFLNGATYVIKDVYYVPDLKNNLLSIGQLQQKGLSFLFQSVVCKVFHHDKCLIFQSYMSTNRMFPISEEMNVVTEHKTDGFMYTSDEDNARLWHERMGHLSNTSTETLHRKGMVRDLPSFPVINDVCRDCMIGK